MISETGTPSPFASLLTLFGAAVPLVSMVQMLCRDIPHSGASEAWVCSCSAISRQILFELIFINIASKAIRLESIIACQAESVKTFCDST